MKGWALLDAVCEREECGGEVPLMRDREVRVTVRVESGLGLVLKSG
jgi:hypothetical protein